MTKEQNYLCTLFKCAILGEDALPPLEPLDWEILRMEAQEQRVDSIVFQTVAALPQTHLPPVARLEAWKNTSIMSGIFQMKKDEALRKVLVRAEEAGICIVLVKGIILSQLYAHPGLRIASDADLFVYEKDRESMASILSSRGYDHSEENSSDNEDGFFNGTLLIELHSRLWEEADGPRFEVLETLGIDRKDSLVQMKYKEMFVWTLAPQQHLFYLVYHMAKHFFVNGIGIRYLSDLALFVKRYNKEIVWPLFWNQVESLGYTTFARSFFYLCNDFFSLPEAVFADTGETHDPALSQQILNDMMESGHSGRRSMARYKASRALRLYYENEKKPMPKNRISILFSLLFPSGEELRNQRMDKQQFSRILPIAWIQRLFFLLMRRKRVARDCTLKERVDCAGERLMLMNRLGMIK